MTQAEPLRILFVCSRNRLRSPTGEAVYAGRPGLSAASCGTAPDAEEPATPDLIEWADVVFAMEGRHRKLLAKKFPQAMRGKKCVVLGIPDDFEFMEPDLVALIESRAGPHLPPPPPAPARRGSKP